jgi:HEPN domain-containing protein
MIKEIYERLGIETDLEEENERFFNRLYSTLEEIKIRDSSVYGEIAFNLGVEYKFLLISYLNHDYSSESFYYNLVVAETILRVIKEYDDQAYTFLKERLKNAVDYSMIDLGVIFKDDGFIKKGVEILDRTALIEPLDWLKKYPNAKTDFEGALQNYLTKDYGEATTRAYSALESLVKTVLGSNKRLDNLIKDLLKLLSLPRQWSTILVNYCDFAHEFSTRHGKKEGKTKDLASEKDTEAYIYFTGLMIRLIIRTIAEKE